MVIAQRERKKNYKIYSENTNAKRQIQNNITSTIFFFISFHNGETFTKQLNISKFRLQKQMLLTTQNNFAYETKLN